MITRIVRLNFQPSFREDFLSIFEKHKSAISNFDGFISIQLLAEIENNATFFTYSKWESENALEEYRNSAYFRKIWSTIKPWFKERANAWSLEEL